MLNNICNANKGNLGLCKGLYGVEYKYTNTVVRQIVAQMRNFTHVP